jgi:hypothetical protein
LPVFCLVLFSQPRTSLNGGSAAVIDRRYNPKLFTQPLASINGG